MANLVPSRAADPVSASLRLQTPESGAARTRIAQSGNKAKHRPEIDGLRAVAVVPVVLFHAGMGFDGGYVGVDIFFVISGFLITSLIRSDMRAGTFRLANFWERRVRRILPAAVLMVLSCLVAGWWALLPGDFDQLGRSAVAQSLFVSNVYFWKETGYFTTDLVQPLLHTWSLAVEEQFYLLFPFFLLGLNRLPPRWSVRAIAAGGVLSLLLGVFATRTHPMAAFYLLPARAWELLLGALLAVIPVSSAGKRWVNELVGYAGIAAIALAVFLYDKETPFPGWAALLPCCGTAAIIWSNAAAVTSLGRILSLRPVVWIGLISYSWYLWHWPVLVFADYWSVGGLAWSARLAAVLGSLGLAFLSWKFVETPFRQRVILRQRSSAFAFAVTALTCLALVGFAIDRRKGAGDQWPAAALRYFAGRKDRDSRPEADLRAVQKGDLPGLGIKDTHRPIDLLVWGDSHARALLGLLDEMCAAHQIRGVAATHAATVPLLDFRSAKKFSLSDEAIPYNHAVVEFVRTRHVRNVLIAARWNTYLPPVSDELGRESFRRALIRTIEELRATGARIFVLQDVPAQDFDVPRTLAIAEARGRDPARLGLPVAAHRERTAFERGVLRALAGNSVTVLDPLPLLSGPSGRCKVGRDGLSLYADRHHLTRYGAAELRPLFGPLFESGNQTF